MVIHGHSCSVADNNMYKTEHKDTKKQSCCRSQLEGHKLTNQALFDDIFSDTHINCFHTFLLQFPILTSKVKPRAECIAVEMFLRLYILKAPVFTGDSRENVGMYREMQNF